MSDNRWKNREMRKLLYADDTALTAESRDKLLVLKGRSGKG